VPSPYLFWVSLDYTVGSISASNYKSGLATIESRQPFYHDAVNRDTSGSDPVISFSYRIVFSGDASWVPDVKRSGTVSAHDGWGILIDPLFYLEEHYLAIVYIKGDGTVLPHAGTPCLATLNLTSANHEILHDIFVGSALESAGFTTFLLPNDPALGTLSISLEISSWGSPFVFPASLTNVVVTLSPVLRAHLLLVNCEAGTVTVLE